MNRIVGTRLSRLGVVAALTVTSSMGLGYGPWAGALAAAQHASSALPAVVAGSTVPHTTVPSTVAVADPVVAVGGDIACDVGQAVSASGCQQSATAGVVSAMSPAAVLALGDEQYEVGSASAFAQMYGPSWGRSLSVTRPVPGNHEYGTAGAGGYFGYFGSAAGAADKGYYSFDLGGWHLIALNSECAQGAQIGCAVGSVQEQWLKADLAAHPAACTLAYWHQPRFSSGNGGNNSVYQPFWQDLYDAHADVVLNGHSHAYERFAPQTPTGAADPALGVREFVVGTGGDNLLGFSAALPNEEVRQNSTFGAMRLVLHPGGYDWQFQPTAGGTWTDSGSGTCHAARSAAPAPSVPTALATSGAVSSSRVALSWAPSTELGTGVLPTVSGYRVYRSDVAAPLNTALVSSPTFTDTTVAPATSYTYTVTAVDSAGTESGRSGSLTVTTAAPPASLGITNGGFESPGLAGWTASGVSAAAGSAARSGLLGAVLGSTSATNGVSSVQQSFTAPAGSTALSFWWQSHCPDTVAYDWASATLLDVTTQTTSSPLPRTCTPNPAWAQVLTPVVAGHAYVLTLSNTDDFYAADPTWTAYDDVTLTAGAPVPPPRPTVPSGLAVSGSPTASQVTLAWAASSEANPVSAGPTVRGYRVYRGGVALTGTPVTGTSFTDSTVSAASSYSYTVSAVDTAGTESAPSAAVSVTTPAAAPPAPAGGPGLVNGGFDNGLTGWVGSGPAVGTSPTGRSSGPSALLGSTSPTNGVSSLSQTFTVPNSGSGTAPSTSTLSLWWQGTCPDTVQYDWASVSLMDNTSGVSTALLANTCQTSSAWSQLTAPVTGGHAYTLSLNSRDDGYATDPTYTRYDDVTVLPTGGAVTPPAPSIPTGLALTSPATASQVSLGWSASTETGGSGATPPTVVSYWVYRDGVRLGTAPVRALTLGDATVSSARTYAYTVSAVDSAGTESGRSAALSVTTPAAPAPTATGVVNGGFETGGLGGWASTGTVAVSSVARTGAASAELGASTPTGTSTLTQSFTAPTGSSTLSLWWQSSCPDTVQYDWSFATLTDQGTGVTSTVLANTCAAAVGWASASAPVVPGHTYTLTLGNHDDGYATDPSWTRFDDVTLS